MDIELYGNRRRQTGVLGRPAPEGDCIWGTAGAATVLYKDSAAERGGRRPESVRLLEQARVQVRVQPGARTNGLVRWDGSVLQLRVMAPPADGRANAAVTRLVAELVGVRAGAVRVVHGTAGRTKLVEIDGLTTADLRQRLAPYQ